MTKTGYEKNSCRRRFFLSLILLSVLVALSGCGYSVHRHSALRYPGINIGIIENKTLEPKLQDKLSRALTIEFMEQGIDVNPAAGYTLSGVINAFDLVGLSEKNDVVVEYRVVVSADFKLVDKDGKTVGTRKIGSPFIVSFTGSGDFGRLMASKELAEERAMRDIASELAGVLIFQ